MQRKPVALLNEIHVQVRGMKYAHGRMKARLKPRMNYRLRRYESGTLCRTLSFHASES